MSHNVLYMRGQVAELRGNLEEALRWYEEALSISPTHVKSMQRLVSDLRRDPHSWMGLCLEAAGSAIPSNPVLVPKARRIISLPGCPSAQSQRAPSLLWFV